MNIKRFSLFMVIAICFSIAGCSADQGLPTSSPDLLPSRTVSLPTKTIATLTSTATISSTSTPTPISATPMLMSTPSPTATPLPTLTSTLGPPITRTPAPAAQCPKSSGQAPKLTFYENVDDYEPQILDYLNAHGSAVGLEEALNLLIQPNSTRHVEADLISKDVTGDNIPDVVMGLNIPGSWPTALLVFACQKGSYATIERQITPGYMQLHAISDMNLDGLAEIVYSFQDCAAGCTTTAGILEWDGTEFASPISLTSKVPEVYNGSANVRDTDGNGTLELILSGGWSPRYGPGRTQHDIWAWNGYAFTLLRTEYDPPVFRIHAIYDGDNALSIGDYAAALAFYQQAIFDEKLVGWGWEFNRDAQGNPLERIIDSEERPRLSAYSRYRIMLLHVIQGDLSAAKIVYDTLQSMFPAATAGHQYAELATMFWEQYQTDQDILSACGKATGYAATYPNEVLYWLGGMGGFYGDSNFSYKLEDICPFK